MATRQEIAKDIKQQFGSALNVRQVSEYLGYSRNTTKNFLTGLSYFGTAKDKKFLAIDIAKKIESFGKMY